MRTFDHCEDVLKGIYDMPLEFSGKPPVILDIGANVGAFVMWAGKRWPGSKFICYEPVPSNFAQLVQNAASSDSCELFNVGVRMCGGQMQIAEGVNNCGEWTTQTGVNKMTGVTMTVPCIRAKDLPHGNVLKIDTEGCELEILNALWDAGRDTEFCAIMVEWHRESDRLEIDQLLKANYQMAGAYCEGPERGVAKYVFRNLVKKI